MKKFFLVVALMSALMLPVYAMQPVFVISGTTTLSFGVPIGGVTISAASTDCGGWTGASVTDGPLISDYSLEIPQACHNLQVTAFKHGYHFLPDQWALFFPTTQIDPITHLNFQVN